MTGFARADGADEAVRWHWEIRSVNGRGLDLRLRLPPGFDGVESRLRDMVGRQLTRGNVSATLTVDRAPSEVQIRLNERALADVVAAARRISDLTGTAMPNADALLAVRGVLEVAEAAEGEDVVQLRSEAMARTFETAVESLVAARRAEGQRLAKVLDDLCSGIAAIVERIAALPSRRAEAVAQRLRDALQRIVDNASGFDETRLHQEAMLLATKADVEEELKRLAAHVAAARDLLQANEPVGRKLDFLAQEFNREANTICSKSNDIELTRLGLDLKALIEQLREQVQNIE